MRCHPFVCSLSFAIFQNVGSRVLLCVLHVATERVGGLMVEAVGLALSPAALVWVGWLCSAERPEDFSVAGSLFSRFRSLVASVDAEAYPSEARAS